MFNEQRTFHIIAVIQAFVQFFLPCNCNQLRVSLSLDLVSRGVWHNVVVDNVHQTI